MRIRPVLVAVALALVLTACSAPQEHALPDGLSFTRTASRVLLLHPREDAQGDALLVGRLGVNGHGCMTVGDQVIVVEAGATISDAEHVDIGGRRWALGAELRGGGGTSGELSADLTARLQSLCGVTALWYFDPEP